MKYLLMIHYIDAPTPRDPEAWARLSEEEQQSVFAGYQAVSQTPGVTSSGQLQPPEAAATVRVVDGETQLTEGPVGSPKEAVNGYLAYEADNLDAAIELAARIPTARMGGAVEIRPFVEG